MFDPVLLDSPPDVIDVPVNGETGVGLDLALPELLERLSIALHRHDATGTRALLFRTLAAGGSQRSVRQRTQTLLASAEVRAAMQVVLEHATAFDFADKVSDAAAATYSGPDEEPLEGDDLDLVLANEELLP